MIDVDVFFEHAGRLELLHVLRRRLGPEPTAPVHGMGGDDGRDFFRLCDGTWDQVAFHQPDTCVGVALGESGALYAIDEACVTCPACREPGPTGRDCWSTPPQRR